MWINEKSETYGKSPSEMLDEPEFLSDAQLIGLVLSDGKSCPPKSTCDLIKDSLYGTEYEPDGMTDAQKRRYMAMMEIVRRFGIKKGTILKTPESIYNYTRHFAYEEQEVLVVLSFNGSGEIISCNVATKGLADKTVIHPREVFKECIKNSGIAVAIVHNHPSGSTLPSSADLDMTERIIEAGKILGIKVLDHLIITTGGYYSMRERGDM